MACAGAIRMLAGKARAALQGRQRNVEHPQKGRHLRMATAASRRAKAQQYLAMQASAKTTKPEEERLQ